ncbi:MAG: hypothetical protein QOD73_1061 [Solirubrobacteraceae bacterium]|nr:hypothetical protein [Solirubrobacteraceae bacterium]
MAEPEMWGGELDPPRRLRWHRKRPAPDGPRDAAAPGEPGQHGQVPEGEIRAARLPAAPDTDARAATGRPSQRVRPTIVAGAARRIAEARYARRRTQP